MTQGKLLLFDLDGTLLVTRGAGFRSIARVVEERYGVIDELTDIVPDGKTDPMIFREVLRTRRLVEPDAEDAEIAAITVRYEELMCREMPAAPGATVLPGVVELLDELAGRTDVMLGVLTGNLEVTARAKLARFDLNRFFPFGAFSSDHHDRERLVPVAVQRAEEWSGEQIGLGDHVIVIGDTPRDVECALANGATAVGVASGRPTAEELWAAGAHAVLPSLEDRAAFLHAAGLDGS